MKHASQSEFGRPRTAALSQHPAKGSHASATAPTDPYDKWALLQALTDAATLYELNHRTLGVLKALLTFWPDRTLTPDVNSCIVFPSNRVLASRLNGMPDSTLRRHLAKLVSLGVVSRHASANHKRFARRITGAVQQAYGFDLSPLARHSDHLVQQAAQARTAHHQLMILRDHVAVLRQSRLEQNPACPLVEEARQVLRRKPDLDALTGLKTALSEALSNQDTPPARPRFCDLAAAEMSTTDVQNERHIQDSLKQDFDSEGLEKNASETALENSELTLSNDCSDKARLETKSTCPAHRDLELNQILGSCSEALAFFPNPVRSWQDLLHLGDRLAPMLGIDQPVLSQAKQHMGPLEAAISVLCILQRASEIRSPGAYLRRLAQKASAGGFSVRPMLLALKNREKAACSV
ncbi:plasmid replication protein RepC [Phaeobacter sp. CECT 5382]|uniref:plasmid replication protein RepC n=1 Tax=Phaeobacter sp. CECT 5382 TaxID=1712645 RepID=UPI0009E93EA8|nr:plasmid replication protein RepC [Phaeobacter sp. CECT 5382]